MTTMFRPNCLGDETLSENWQNPKEMERTGRVSRKADGDASLCEMMHLPKIPTRVTSCERDTHALASFCSAQHKVSSKLVDQPSHSAPLRLFLRVL
jgi:hypothetical protein